MSRRSSAIDQMPIAVLTHLRELGDNLSLARKRRQEPLTAWAQRIGVSVPTVMRMEKGDPAVSMAVYATALWIMGRDSALPDLAAPEHDRGALEQAIRVAKQRAVRKRRTTQERLAAGWPVQGDDKEEQP